MNHFYIETYGCRMNICDSEVIVAILSKAGMKYVNSMSDADVIILNSCSVREDGHNKIYERLTEIGKNANLASKVIVVTGCFASLLTDKLFKQYDFVNIVVNPNCYRQLPDLLQQIRVGKDHLLKSLMDSDEMYGDILPQRVIEDRTTAAINVMKGCNQCCSYCIEPVTRGHEHCRDVESVLKECDDIVSLGYREITLVGHIIDKYHSIDSKSGKNIDFAELLKIVAERCPEQRIKFLSSHPLFFDERIAQIILSHPNIMRVVHLPVQSGANKVLRRMDRGYTKEQFVELIGRLRRMIPDLTIITDVMVGFCGESHEEFEETVDLVKSLQFDDINVFCFSMRSRTKAFKLYADDVDEEEKIKRAQTVKDLRDSIKYQKNKRLLGQRIGVIVESKDNLGRYYGRDMFHHSVYFTSDIPLAINDKVIVLVKKVSCQGLIGNVYSI